jgi:hypothetical protein
MSLKKMSSYSQGGLFRSACLLGLFFSFSSAQAGFEEDYEKQTWQEIAVQLPAAPQKESLIPFYVSAATDNKFFVDPGTLTVGVDGVVRYVLVVLTSGGARNVSYEAMRCETRERRIYASGRIDGTWSKSRSNEWEPIREAVANRHYAALFIEYFCPGGVIVRRAEEAVGALRAGGHPENKRW